MGRLLDITAALVCIAGGIYLLSIQSVAGNTVIEAIGHGIGVYCIGKGLFIARSTHLESQVATATRKLVELTALRHERDSGS